MIPNLISIITPCYNTAKLLPRLLDSILKQDYPLVEMYAINDGSTDDTEIIIKEYIPKFAQKGYSLNYVYQPNSGQSVVLNNGLKLIKGEFLVWPDSDDWYSTPNALSRMVEVFKESDDSVGMVRCLVEYVSESTFEITRRTPCNNQIRLFEDCLFHRNGFWFCSGGYMGKVQFMKQYIEDLEIFTAKNAGQNWQLMLPVLYNKKCITINEYHYQVLQRFESHSRGQYKSYDAKVLKLETYKETIISTLSRMFFLSDTLKHEYIRDIEIKYLKEHYNLAMYYSIWGDAKKIEEKLNTVYGVHIPLQDKIRCVLSKNIRLIKMFFSYDKYCK